MSYKKIINLILFILIFVGSIFGGGMIEESEIPMPKVQYELPEALIGEFIMASYFSSHEITIFPNNKYIVIRRTPGHPRISSYGYIVKNDNKWYFSPALGGRDYFKELTEINLTNSGFSYYREGMGFLYSIRKEDMPIPKQLVDLSVPSRSIRQQYFRINDSETGKIDFNEVETTSSDFPPWCHYLQIDNGIVYITRTVGLNGGGGIIVFEGFIEKTNESIDKLQGIIRFTNGVPYYYIHDGTAEIEINSDGGIIISMLYTTGAPNSVF